MKDTAKALPKDIVMCAWFYSSPQVDNAMRKSVTFFSDIGFDMTGSPWFQHENAYAWAKCLCERRKHSPHALGEIYTSWIDKPVDPWQALLTTAEYTWTVAKPPFEEWMAQHRK